LGREIRLISAEGIQRVFLLGPYEAKATLQQKDVPTGTIVQAVKENQATYLGLSALLTATMRVMQDVIDALKEEGLRDNVKVFIGGAPTSKAFAEQIGADAHCKDAFEAINVLKTIASWSVCFKGINHVRKTSIHPGISDGKVRQEFWTAGKI
jgi:cobalamin-dependent methionine synthase I